jgi:CubicO group peptidase (beta-lactamase class C family)
VEQELRRVPPRTVPLAEHDYSNFGYQMLGLVLERADRRPLPDLFGERVFAPLGMASTGVAARVVVSGCAGMLGAYRSPGGRIIYGVPAASSPRSRTCCGI